MAQPSSSNPNSLPGIVTDQPEIYESEPALSDDTGVNDLDLAHDPTDEAIALIEVPIKQAFSYFAERENEIAQFYVQRYGEYKLSGDKPEEETDLEKYHRLVIEVNQLLNKFQADKVSKAELATGSLDSTALVSNLEVLIRQLKTLEFAAENGSLEPIKSGFETMSTSETSKGDTESKQDEEARLKSGKVEDTAKLIRMSALERRINVLETLLGHSEEKAQSLFKTTKCESLIEVADTLGSWLSFFKPDTIQKVNRELDYLTQRLEKINELAGSSEENKLDSQSKAKLDQLCNLVTATDKYRSMVPTIIHRLNAMGELQEKASQVTETLRWLELKQTEIEATLQANKEELETLPKRFNENIELLRKLSTDIDSRITALREKNN